MPRPQSRKTTSRRPLKIRALKKLSPAQKSRESTSEKSAGNGEKSQASAGGARLRLQKYLAAAGLGSRRKCEELITGGRVTVNGAAVSELGVTVDAEVDVVAVDGRQLAQQQKSYYRFHKPVGIHCTFRDPFGRPGLDSFVEKLPVRVFAVGRLDADTCGLLLLTNDGDFAQQMLHPSYGVERVYRAAVHGVADEQVCRNLLTEISLDDGPARAVRAAPVRPSARTRAIFGDLPKSQSLIEIVVTEGRKHFVKRLLAAHGYPVQRLCRISFGSFALGKLVPGEIKELSPQEVDSHKRLFNSAPAG